MGQLLSQPVSSQNLQRKGNQYLRVGASEMQGFRINMEDTMTIMLDLEKNKHPEVGFFAVFDGHAGQRASEYLASYLHDVVGQVDDPTDPNQLTKAVLKVDAEFCADEARRQDGSTSVFAVVKPRPDGTFTVVVSNVGDSRAILIRGDTGDFVALTNDHKPDNEAEKNRIVAAGGMVQANRVDGQLAMSRAVGDWTYKQNPNLPPDKQKVIATPEIASEVARPGDFLLLCCDGIVESLTNEQVVKFVHDHCTGKVAGEEKEFDRDNLDPATITKKLLDYSLQAGSKDNHSAILLSFQSGVDYGRDPDFIAGPFKPFQNDKQFVKAYLADAEKHGYSGDRLMDMAAIAEKNMPEQARAPANDDSGGRMMLQQLIASTMSGGNAADPQSIQDQLLALSNLLSGHSVQLELVQGDEDNDQGDS